MANHRLLERFSGPMNLHQGLEINQHPETAAFISGLAVP